MNKLIISTFTFLLLFLFTVNVNAAPIVLNQGMYSARDSGLTITSPMTAKINNPNGRVILIIIDANQSIKELVRLEPSSVEHTLKPLDYGSYIIIFGNTPVTFS